MIMQRDIKEKGSGRGEVNRGKEGILKTDEVEVRFEEVVVENGKNDRPGSWKPRCVGNGRTIHELLSLLSELYYGGLPRALLWGRVYKGELKALLTLCSLGIVLNYVLFSKNILSCKKEGSRDDEGTLLTSMNTIPVMLGTLTFKEFGRRSYLFGCC